MQRSAKTKSRREANRFAGKLEAELLNGTYFKPNNITWAEFRELFEEFRVPYLKRGTVQNYNTTFNRFELLLKPFRLSKVNSLIVARFQNRLRDLGNSEATIAKHLRQLKAALKWAKSMNWLQKVPVFKMPKAGRHQRVMKGRPVTDAEFEEMLAVVGAVVGEESEASWCDLLNGVMLSGLRLGEALALTWQRSDDIYVDLKTGKYPVFRISAAKDKGGVDRVLPMVPEFAKFLEKLGPKDTGFVFNLGRVKTGRKEKVVRATNWVSQIGSRIGREAGLVVSESGKKVKYASFHDLRRSFGVRWSKTVSTATLRHLMRHSSIDTTLRYYVGEDADRVAEELWAKLDAD